jgi:hypothetical protein
MKTFSLYPQFQQLPDPRLVGTNLPLSEQVDANDELSLSSYLLPFECLNSQVHHIESQDSRCSVTTDDLPERRVELSYFKHQVSIRKRPRL